LLSIVVACHADDDEGNDTVAFVLFSLSMSTLLLLLLSAAGGGLFFLSRLVYCWFLN
jgi:hypothetical protein